MSSKAIVIEKDFGHLHGFFNIENGKYFIIQQNEVYDSNYIEEIYKDLEFFKVEEKVIFDNVELPVITVSLNITSKCNLNCTYCFSEKRDSKDDISYDAAIHFINMIMLKYPNSVYFQIDVTGDGEPLLRFDLIKKLVEYSKLISTKEKTVRVGFCTNGTLLTREIINYLEKNEIYYGISIDGTKESNDYYRKSFDNKSVYKTIINNIKKSDLSFRGAAVTLTNQSIDLVKSMKKLSDYFEVISIKPVREFDIDKGAITKDNIDLVLESYNHLLDFLIKETLKLNTWYLVSILRDEDLFGKFIRRVFLNQSVATRCGGGISKFALGKDKNIYVCGAASRMSQFKVGSITDGIDENRKNELIDQQLKRISCQDCWAQYICGGMCMIHEYNYQRKYGNIDKSLCKLNQHLIGLAFVLKDVLFHKHYNIYQKIYGICMDNHYK